MQKLLEEIYYNGPQVFSRERLISEPALFRQRVALYYTPTESLPNDLVGSGILDVYLPLALPTIFEADEIVAHRNPRLWVDLLQRATRKLRWHPICPARVTIIRYDLSLEPVSILQPKALIDALKVKTAGRNDDLSLYYFGAISDDDPFSAGSTILQEAINDLNKVGCRIIVEPMPDSAEPPFPHTSGILAVNKGGSKVRNF